MSASDILRDARLEVPEEVSDLEEHLLSYMRPHSHMRAFTNAALEALAREVVKWEAVSRVNAEECMRWKRRSDLALAKLANEIGVAAAVGAIDHEQETKPCV